jgi:A/G-specific adenine glycosylase
MATRHTEKHRTLPMALPDAAWRRSFRRRLRGWYQRAARDLPWRRDRDPYRIWISEIMLQQTQVATVEAYFNRFIAAFPDVTALAAADEDAVLRLWEGLGYYRRARQMHKAARLIVEQHGGQFPRDVTAVHDLPGVGRYTAGAILSIAYDDPQPILEANSQRLLCRLLAYRDEPTRAEGQRLLWAAAEAILPRRGAGEVNQAIMELGSQICTPKAPQCDVCPLKLLCGARAHGLQEEIPRAKKKRPIEEVRQAAIVIYRRGRVLLLRRGDDERWAGMWDFPRFDLYRQQPAAIRREIIAQVGERVGMVIDPSEHLTTITHSVTRFRIKLECHAARYVKPNGSPATPPEMKWLHPSQLDTLPLSVTGRKLSRLVIERS